MRILTSIACIVIACQLAKAEQAKNDLVILDEISVKNLGIQIVEAEERRFEESVFAIGRLEEIPASRSVLSSRISGRVVDIRAFEGDVVSDGQVLAVVESRQLGSPPPTVELVAPRGGMVVNSHIRLGQPVDPSSELLDIVDRSRLWAVAKIPEREASRVRVGTEARIRIPSLGQETVRAKLIRFGVDADRQAGAVEGIFLLENQDGRLLPGMRAEFSVVLDTHDFVLSIPVEAVQGDPVNRFVFVKDFDLPNAFLKAPVVLGQQNESWVEVRAGLFPGDEVVTHGSYLLSFAGGGSGISLKEALDAAHGHEHNEDGSEITPEQKAATTEETVGHEHAHEHETPHWLFYYAIVVTIVCAIAIQRVVIGSRKAR